MSESRESMLQTWSDLHKDAYGFRPRDWSRVSALSDAEMTAEWDRMVCRVEESIAEEATAQAAATVRFEARVAETIAMGAGDRATAIRWIGDAENATMGGQFDSGYLEYICGLPYGYLRQKEAA